ncbi:hypothetical protein [Haliscomenobacter sp.]|uniref:hypothetical protein n=1 Tax=Haliscomenobacter sp. TaxID=2717303 RepID=UPI0035934FBC
MTPKYFPDLAKWANYFVDDEGVSLEGLQEDEIKIVEICHQYPLPQAILLDIFEKCEEKREIRVYQDAKNVCFPRTYANLKHCTLGLA